MAVSNEGHLSAEVAKKLFGLQVNLGNKLMSTLRLGTRGSKLALWQANHVADLLRRAVPGLEIAIEVIKTQGDKILDVSLSKIGDKGLFTKEIELALLDKRVDLAVHSMKDLPSVLQPGLCLGAVVARENPRDVLLSSHGSGFAELPRGARVVPQFA